MLLAAGSETIKESKNNDGDRVERSIVRELRTNNTIANGKDSHLHDLGN